MSDIKIMFFNYRHFAKRCSFFQASWPVSPFLVRLELKSNTFCDNWNGEYNILQIIKHYIIASNVVKSISKFLFALFIAKIKKLSNTVFAKLHNLQARKCFLKISKLGGIWWETSFFGEQLLRYSSIFNTWHLVWFQPKIRVSTYVYAPSQYNDIKFFSSFLHYSNLPIF